jgi:hypothetical protein
LTSFHSFAYVTTCSFRNGSKSSSDDEELAPELTEAEKAELIQLEELAKTGDHSNRLLFLAKKGHWDAARHILLSSKRFDFTLTDQVCLYTLLLTSTNRTANE